MAFDLNKTMKNIKSNKLDDRIKTKNSLFNYIKELDNISQQTKDALNIYLKCRLKLRGLDYFTVVKFNAMVTELLEGCCDKNLFEITPEDTDNNFDKILYHLKYAISHKFRFKIYHEEEMDFNKLDTTKVRKSNHILSKEELETLFRGLVQI